MKSPQPRRIKHRIIGIENELGMKFRPKLEQPAYSSTDPTPVTVDELAKLSLPPELQGRFLNGRAIQPNQAQIYIDTGKHPEYASPECLGARETALYETAGLGIMARAVKRYNEHYLYQEKISLHKTNRNCIWSDNTGLSKFSWGSHANFLSLRRVADSDRAEKTMAFLVSRWPLIGNGWFKIANKKYLRLLFSQRGELMQATVTSGTVEEKKPLINTRDEPQTNKEIWRRIHDISGNGNMSPYQLWLKYGALDIILAMVEDADFLTAVPKIVGAGGIRLDIEEAHSEACHLFNADILCQTKVELADGRRWSSIDFQRYYLNEARRFFTEGRGILTKERKEIMEFWGEILDALERWNLPYLARFLDWAAVLYYEIIPRLKRLGLDPKLLLMKEQNIIDPSAEENGIPYNFLFERKGKQETLINYFLYFLTSYANVDTSVSPYGHYLRNNMINQLFSKEEVNYAESYPPRHTRANLREYLTQNLPENMQVKDLSWNRMAIGPQGLFSATEEIKLSNPYCSTAGKAGQKFCPINKYQYPPPSGQNEFSGS